MALPTGGTWPPRNLDPIYAQYALHNAWYVGDSNELARAYEGHTGTRPANRPSQYRGGLVGWGARMFWGEPTPGGEKRTKLHVPVAADIAAMCSKLLYSEPPSITVKDKAAQERIEELIEQGLQASLLEGSEVGSALGGFYLKAVWDKTIAEKPWLQAVHADAAVPEFRWGRLSAVTFHRLIEQDDRTFIRHLERHEPGHIFNGLYVGESGSLGKQLPLTSHAETQVLQPVVETRIKKLSAVYFPNMRPNKEWRNLPAGANLGRSDIGGATLGLMDALDETYTSWMRDIRLAKARLIVPTGYLQSRGPGKGAGFDLDREIYEEVDALPGEGLEISAQQFAIRVAEHRDSSAEFLAAILRSAGYSAQSFGLTGEVAVTATEVMAKERQSFTTTATKTVYAKPELATAVEMLLELEAALFGSPITPERPTIVFGDSVSADMLQLATTAELMRRAEAASDETIVRHLHPDWDDTEIQAEVDRIAEARPKQVMDPLALPEEMQGGAEGEDPAAEEDGPPKE